MKSGVAILFCAVAATSTAAAAAAAPVPAFAHPSPPKRVLSSIRRAFRPTRVLGLRPLDHHLSPMRHLKALQSSASGSCSEQLAAFGTQCGAAFSLSDTSLTAAQREAAVCTATTGCVDVGLAALEACGTTASSSLSADEASTYKTLQFLLNAFSSLCPKDGKPGCFDKAATFSSDFASLDLDSGAPTQDAMARVCSECTGRVIKVYMSILTEFDSSGQSNNDLGRITELFRAICTQDPTTKRYCFPDVASFASNFDSEKICANPCVRKVTSLYLQAALPNGTEDVQNVMRFICAKGPAGYCYKVISTPPAGADPSVCESLSATPPSCSDDCKAYVTSAVDGQGCCMASIATIAKDFSPTGDYAGLRELGDIYDTINAQCGMNIDVSADAACKKLGKVVGKVSIRGLTKAVVDANKDRYYKNMQTDLSSNTGVTASDITITGHEAVAASRRVVTLADEGVAFQYDIATEDEASAKAVETELNDEASNGSLELPSVDATTSEVAPGTITTVEATASSSAAPDDSTPTTSPSSAALVHVNGALLLVSVLALVIA